MHCEKMIVLAGKYVLGHLSEQDAADAERRMQSDPEFRRIVSQWRDRLADLEGVAEPIEPSSNFGGGCQAAEVSQGRHLRTSFPSSKAVYQ
jgi:anti-sigma-K factor RskA